MRVVAVLAISLGVVVVLAAGGATYWLLGNARVNATIHAVNKDIDKANADGDKLAALGDKLPAFPDMSNPSSAADYANSANQAVAVVQQRLDLVDKAGGLVSDIDALVKDGQRQVDASYRDFLTIPERSRLDRERRSLGYEQQAVVDGHEMVKVAHQELTSVKDMMVAMAAYGQLVEKLDGKDYAGALALYPQVHSGLAQAQQDAQGAHLPDVWGTMLKALGTLVDDTRDAVQALQSGDYATAQAKASDIEAQGTQMNSLDTSALETNSYLADLAAKIKSLEDKANSAR